MKTPPKKRGRPARPDRHAVPRLPIPLPPPLREIVQKIADAEERSLSQMCLILIREGARGRGHDVPGPPASS